MEEEIKKQKVKSISIVVLICVATLICIAGASIGMYKFFYYKNVKAQPTLSKSNLEEENIESEEVIILDSETLEELDIDENAENNEEQAKEELTEEEKQKKQEELKKKQEEEKKKQAAAYPYWIKVNYTANTVTIYKKDDSGNYTIPVKAMVCSTGRSTPRSRSI